MDAICRFASEFGAFRGAKYVSGMHRKRSSNRSRSRIRWRHPGGVHH
jgi:hypothetical protein